MYRDETTVVRARVHHLRAQVATLRTRPEACEVLELRARLEKNRRDIARARRALWRLRHPVLRLLPRSIVEVVFSAGVAYAVLLTAGLGALIFCTLIG